MSQKTIEIKDAIQFGWDTLRVNFAFYIKLLLVLIVVSLIPAMIIAKLTSSFGPYLGLPLQFLNLVWQAVIGMGMMKICMKLYDRQAVEFSDLWSCIPSTLDYVIVKVVYTCIVIIGLLLLIIPGLIWAMQFFLASYLVVDRGTSAVAALKGSSAVTRGAKWDLGIFASVVLGLNFIGVLLLGVGLLVTLPITMLATVHAYRSLLKQTEAGSQPIPLK